MKTEKGKSKIKEINKNEAKRKESIGDNMLKRNNATKNEKKRHKISKKKK